MVWFTHGRFDWEDAAAHKVASLVHTINFNNGKSVTLNPSGKVSIHRPRVSMVVHTVGPREMSYYGLVTLISQGISFVVRVESKVNGTGGITQLILDPDFSGMAASSRGTFLDHSAEFYAGTDSIQANRPTNLSALSDQPQNANVVPPVYIVAGFEDYIRFQPASAGSIFATLGVVTWNLNLELDDVRLLPLPIAPMWDPSAPGITGPNGPNNSSAFPEWEESFYPSHIPLPE
jgi:hypothetical protein